MMRILSRSEDILLATVWKLQEEANGVAINQTINSKAGLNWKFGSIYTPGMTRGEKDVKLD